MIRRQLESSNKYQEDKRKAKPLIEGTTVLRILCGMLIVLNLWLIYGIFSASRGIQNYRRHREQVISLERKIENLQHENRILFRQIQSFKQDPKVRERAVRQQLGWVRENELLIEFVPPERNVP
ncbi:MAG: septum formation initiator family protein [Desulforhabdus sp.]|jgi:cell division protein FtsB|nr:septum formation initiator family protein [Desulforhabdus sp.]